MTPLLEIRNLETFYGPIMALRGVSLEVHKGRVVTVLGANGAGKTTLLKTLSGIMDPEKGKILFEGQEIQGKEPHKVVRAGIVHVPEGREVFPLLTVEENLALGAYTRSDKAEIARDREARDALEALCARRAARSLGVLATALALGALVALGPLSTILARRPAGAWRPHVQVGGGSGTGLVFGGGKPVEPAQRRDPPGHR
mgnify:CR=1 FL=1